MTYVSQNDLWGTGGHHVVSLPPSPGDLFVVTCLRGKPVLVDPITDYDRSLRRAGAFARRVVHPQPVVVKLLCLTLAEAQALGLAPAELFTDQTPEDAAAMRQLAISACTDALRTSSDAQVRADALKLLIDLGAMR